MTAPPPGPPDPPEGRWPWLAGPGQPGPPQPSWPVRRRSPRADVFGGAAVGAVVYVTINTVIGPWVLWGLANILTPNLAFGLSAVSLALVAFGAGSALVAQRSPSTKGFGLGLMIGWALTSILTLGICTGLNPVMYGWPH